MKKFLLLTLSLTYVLFVLAGSITEKQALQKARQFMPGKSLSITQKTSQAGLDFDGITPFYVFNAEKNAGFVIVSGDDRTKAILGYSDTGTIDFNNLPDNVKWWLNYYAEVIASLEENISTSVNNNQSERKDIKPLIKTQWNQSSPYWDQCVFNGIQCYAGCVATAMAQIIGYYKYPNKISALEEYTCGNGYTIPASPATSLNWKNICNTYKSSDNRTAAQKKEIATLMRYCGQSIYMNYGPNGSGAYYSNVPTALVKYFGYSENMRLLQRANYSIDSWENMIYEELAGSHPVLYSGQASNNTNSGHAFVVDGYEDGLYHVNWGWGGYCDGYFVLTVMDSMGPDNPSRIWNQYQRALIGVRPLITSVKLNKSKATLEKGKTLTLKATVSPEELQDKSVTWKSSDTKVATVTSTGKVKAIEAGTATITCTSNATGAKATCKVTVCSISINKSEVTVETGKTVTLKATVLPTTLSDLSVTWESSNKKVATVSSSGKVKGIKKGTATITCTSAATGLSATCKVKVVNGTVTLDKSELAIELNKTATLKATVTPTTLKDKSVTWKSSNTKVATVTSKGKVKGIKFGTATITCTSVATGESTTCKVTVGKVVVGASEITLKKSRTIILTPELYPTSLADKSVTWKSSNTKVAKVTSDGKVTGIKAGTATITCTSVATGLSGTCKVTVLASEFTRSVDGDDVDSTTGIEMKEDGTAVAEPYDVYDMSGRKVRHQVTSLDGLPNGIYIVNGKKVLKK